MKLKDFLSTVITNRANNQDTACFKKNKLKSNGISKDDLLNMKVDFKLKKLLFDED